MIGAQVICWGEVLWDRFPDGAQLGGAPANVAYHLAALGVDVALVTRVGEDADGERAIAELAAAGVDVSLVQRDPERATGEVGIAVEAGEARYRFHPGRAWEAIELTDQAATRLAGAAALCTGTFAQRTEAGRAAHGAARAALGSGAIAVCDPNLRRDGFADLELIADWLARSNAVKINEAEAAALESHLGVPSATAWLLAQPACELVALTRGPGGCRIATPEGAADRGGVPARPGGDNVGCGDAFVAVLVAGLLAGDELELIADRANRYASHVAGCRGATPPIPAAAKWM